MAASSMARAVPVQHDPDRGQRCPPVAGSTCLPPVSMEIDCIGMMLRSSGPAGQFMPANTKSALIQGALAVLSCCVVLLHVQPDVLEGRDSKRLTRSESRVQRQASMGRECQAAIAL
jgi:hypothetical protein